MEHQPPKTKVKWYKKWWGISIIVLVILYFGSALIVRFFGDPNSEQTVNTQSTAIDKNEVDNTNSIPYEVVEAWDIPEGKGTVIVIDPKYDNPNDLDKLGKQIDVENKNNKTVYVSVYTSKEAASYRKSSFCSLEESSPIRKYKQYWAALYTKGTKSAGGEYAVWGARDCTPNIENKVTDFPA